MPEDKKINVSEKEALEIAEASREKEWKKPSFMRELFMGHFRTDMIDPYPVVEGFSDEFKEFYEKLKKVVKKWDPREVDELGEYPWNVVEELKKIGAFGMKIPKEYGGLGFSNLEYQKVIELLGTWDGSLVALLSAHQSIGVPQPIKLFGSEELKRKYLPRCAKGEISAFALTEIEVGSDPARLTTTVQLSEDGTHYILNGSKLWCTNGPIADLIVVMARDSRSKKISAFVVESKWEGVKVEHRCRFMGLRAISNGVIRFHNVKVPKENLIGKEGKGLKIALTTLNDGRLSIPNASIGIAKLCLNISRRWGRDRVQWGKPIGKHEAIAHKIAKMAATIFAMESMVKIATWMSDSKRFDIRLEAAACKEWITERTWEIIDDTVQIRGGRGYETETSLKMRGEVPIPAERILRDYRINRIFEGSSEIMHLFIAREALDKHLQIAGSLIDPKIEPSQKFKDLTEKVLPFYLKWYPTTWLGWNSWPAFSEYGELARHMRFIKKSSKRLARTIFHLMLSHGPKLQNRQGVLFRVVDIANYLFAMAASISRAHTLTHKGAPNAKAARELTDLFCRIARRRVNLLFTNIWINDDTLLYRTGVKIINGGYRWIEKIVGEMYGDIDAPTFSIQPIKETKAAQQKIRIS